MSRLRGSAVATATMTDMGPIIADMKSAHKALQDGVSNKRPVEIIQQLNAAVKSAYSDYDEKMKGVKRSLRPAPKAKGKGKAKAMPTPGA